MNRRLAALAFIWALAALALPTSASAAPLPAWQLQMVATPTALVPSSEAEYKLVATNVGAAPTSTTATIEATLPSGLSATSAAPNTNEPAVATSCTVGAHLVTCELASGLPSGQQIVVAIGVSVEAPEGALLEPGASISGGGALLAASANAPTTVSTETAPFGILDLRAPSTDEEGLPASAAGSHPYQLTLSMPFPTALPNPANLDGAGHVRDLFGELPRGYLVDPAATPVLCTEAELLSNAGCPLPSQIGIAEIGTTIGGPRAYALSQDAIYNMVPPPGSPASFGFNATGFGIFVHLLSGVRSDGDYGLYGYSSDILALGGHPLLSVQLQLWGDPSSPTHNEVRGECAKAGGSCPVPAQGTALLTAPAACEGPPPRFEARADSWEQPGVFARQTYEAADLGGQPAPITGCNAEPFAPTISSQPTTNVADSPSGLEFTLTQPPDMNKEHVSPAPLKDARVTLPAGLVANPSQADGLAACSEGEIGYLAEDEEAGVHFSKQAQSCPEASKLGTVEVSSPLLPEYEDSAGPGTKLVTDPETGEAIPRPLHGAIYLAKPYDNPFGTLIALYLAVEDERSGIVAKLAGRVEPDPATGQLTTVFEENPELPLSAIKLSLFKGARASLTTPLTCGAHTTTTDLTPWSAPEGAGAHPSDSFQTTAGPGGGACPASEGQATNAPSFEAGTLQPQAGAYSPFVLKLRREDGSQRLTSIDTTLPPGLTGKLAGIDECSEAQIAQARGREHPEMGVLERENPSCPAASEVGTVRVAAGSGPDPFSTSGHAYLAGPYKGAPLSLAVIVPAIAGPFDLGTVVSRVTLHVEPETAQIHAVSDSFPTILGGIPLDLRAVTLEMGRPQFTLNPTSCDPMAITGTATSALGQGASLSQRFQVGGCQGLAFKPKLALRLKGKVRRTAHPRLIANLTARPGEANIARAQVKLPQSVFLDQGHIRTVCTRVQWAADTCPPGSIYGKAAATTPLLGYALAGSVYLRSSSHKLPDLVAKLKGPTSQPIEIDLVGKTDSVKGALRNTFEAVPDAAVSHFRLELFGGKRGLVEMSSGFCKARKANVQLTGQNGKPYNTRPVVAAKCPKAKKHKKRKVQHKKGHKDHHRRQGGHRAGHGSR